MERQKEQTSSDGLSRTEDRVSRIVDGRVLTCKDFTPYKLWSTANKVAEEICLERNLEEAIIYECGTCGDLHILDEPMPRGH